VFVAKIDDLGNSRGNTTWVLAQQRHPVASSEALDVQYWAMCPTLYCRICMAINITSNLPAIVCIVDFVVAHNHS
jgi:hypothetical protein